MDQDGDDEDDYEEEEQKVAQPIRRRRKKGGGWSKPIAGASEQERERELVGSLTGTYRFRSEGLVKKVSVVLVLFSNWQDEREERLPRTRRALFSASSVRI